jgi:hypothetical protein
MTPDPRDTCHVSKPLHESDSKPNLPDGASAPSDKAQSGETWMALCGQAAVEQDPKRLLELVSEINRLLYARKKRLTNRPDGKS